MADEDKSQKSEPEHDQQPSAPGSFPLKPAGEVEVEHLDSPPPSGKRQIHPRRPLPGVPTREQREEEEARKSGTSQKNKSE
jgi:hypothetical protein